MQGTTGHGGDVAVVKLAEVAGSEAFDGLVDLRVFSGLAKLFEDRFSFDMDVRLDV